MIAEDFILKVLKKIESLDSNLITYAYKVKQGWWEISISDFNFYRQNNSFKKLSKAWRVAGDNMGVKIVFVCGWIPTEKKLVSLMNENNLVMCIQ